MTTRTMRRQRILRERAVALARAPQAAAAADTMLELLEFRLARERYALETRHVQEVHPLRDLTPLPGTPPFLLGIVNVRGRILPVLDLKKFFDLPEQGLTDLHRIIRRARQRPGARPAGGRGCRRAQRGRGELCSPRLPTLTGIRAEYLKGVTDERLVVLDLDRILADPKIIVHEEVDS